jgi:Sulfotransferase domain
MSLAVIGAGFGRTGTLSLKQALEILGFSPCHHMDSVKEDPAQAALWLEAADDPKFDWNRLLGEHRAAVDWPTAYFWRELMAFYPNALVILSVRDKKAWYQSVRKTIFNALVPPPGVTLPLAPAMLAMARELVLQRTFQGRLDDEVFAHDVFDAHNRRVRATVPTARLLVFDASEGWAPLCRRLNVPIPNVPYPHANSTSEFRDLNLEKK